MSVNNTGLQAYVPRVASDWDGVASNSLWQPIDGTLVFVDISGFTNLSERLAQKGRIGAEELTSVLNRVFGRMLEIVYDRGGSLLKFGGDALLLLFSTDDHVMQASAATVEMRSALRAASQERTSVGRIDLKMSSGIHTGSVDFFLVGDSHRELVVTGPTASVTTVMEGTADAGEIVVSGEVRELLPAGFTGDRKGEGWLLRKRKINHQACGLIARTTSDEAHLSQFVPRGLREHLQAGIEDSEHRIATIAFVKYKGVDSLMADHGPERVGQELDGLARVVEGAADQEGITFLASDIDADGGKMILAAGVPASQHDDEGRVLRAARRVLDSDLGLSIRIGINRGHVFSGNVGTGFRRTYTVMGDTVNLAARLMAAAESGGLYASPSVLNLSSTLFRTEPLEAFYVKGKEQPVQAFAVYEETGVRPPESTAELPFHGREAELEMLVGIVNTCSRVGRGGIMTISGDTGVGKSRLITEVLERCAGMDTMAIQAEPSGVDNPYWAFRDPLRRWLSIERGPLAEMAKGLTRAIRKKAPHLEWALPLLGDVMHIEIEENQRTSEIDPQFRPERTADVLIELLSAGYTRPVAVVAEDGQWLDEASLRLLARIGDAAAERPWTVLVTARATESHFAPMGEEIVLRPLEDHAIREIAIEFTRATPLRPHELESIVSKADGNPLFLGEILRVISETGSAEQLPDSLDAVISREIDTLPPLPRQLLRYSSVLGRRFRRPVLNEFLGAEQGQFDEATVQELRRFIEDEGEDRLAFRHSVVHDIAYSSLPYAKRRELHARAGDVIKRQAGKDVDGVAEYLAHHYSEAGEWNGALEFSLKAGAKAYSLYANVQAASFYQRALAAAKELQEEPPEIAALHEARGDALERAGLFEESLNEYAAAIHRASDVLRRADLMFKRARLKAYSGNYPAGLAELSRALGPLDKTNAEAARGSRARIHSFRSVIRIMQGRAEDALRLAELARAEADQAREREALARAYMVLDAAHETLGRQSDTDYLPRALEIYEEMGDLLGAALVYNNMGATAWFDGRLDDAIALYSKADETSRRAGNEPDAANARANIGEVLIARGELEQAREVLQDATRVLRAHDSHQAVFADIHLARVDLETGRLSESIERLQRTLQEADSMGQTEWVLIAKAHLASAKRAQGEPEMALALINEAEASVGQAGDLYGPLLALVRAETLRDLGDPSGALESAVAGRELASSLGLYWEHSELDRLVAQLDATAVRV